jgi:hypothetical protein
MDGSTASLIAIPIVVTLSLAAWLLLVAYAASHPQWKHGPAMKHGPTVTSAREAPADADHHASPEVPEKLAA